MRQARYSKLDSRVKVKAALGSAYRRRHRAEEFRKRLGDTLIAIQHRCLAQQISPPLVLLKLTVKRAERLCLLKIAGVLRQVLEQSNPFFHGANGSPDGLFDRNQLA